MKIAEFEVETWMTDHENHCRYNLTETCVSSLSLNDLQKYVQEDISKTEIYLTRPELELERSFDNKQSNGGYSIQKSPLPIPNREVKAVCADDTAIAGEQVAAKVCG